MFDYMVLFYTHSGAIKFQRRMKSLKVPCKLMPVPRSLSSNCGIGARISFDKDHSEILNSEIEKVFLIESDKFHLVHSQEE